MSTQSLPSFQLPFWSQGKIKVKRQVTTSQSNFYKFISTLAASHTDTNTETHFKIAIDGIRWNRSEPLELRLSFQCQCNPREGCGNAWCWAASKWTYFLHVLNFRKSCKECQWYDPTTSRLSAFQSDANHQPLSILGQESDGVCGRHHNLVKGCVFLGKMPGTCGCRNRTSPNFWIFSLMQKFTPSFKFSWTCKQLSPETAGLKGFGSFSSQGAKSAFSKLKA